MNDCKELLDDYDYIEWNKREEKDKNDKEYAKFLTYKLYKNETGILNISTFAMKRTGRPVSFTKCAATNGSYQER